MQSEIKEYKSTKKHKFELKILGFILLIINASPLLIELFSPQKNNGNVLIDLLFYGTLSTPIWYLVILGFKRRLIVTNNTYVLINPFSKTYLNKKDIIGYRVSMDFDGSFILVLHSKGEPTHIPISSHLENIENINDEIIEKYTDLSKKDSEEEQEIINNHSSMKELKEAKIKFNIISTLSVILCFMVWFIVETKRFSEYYVWLIYISLFLLPYTIYLTITNRKIMKIGSRTFGGYISILPDPLYPFLCLSGFSCFLSMKYDFLYLSEFFLYFLWFPVLAIYLLFKFEKHLFPNSKKNMFLTLKSEAIVGKIIIPPLLIYSYLAIGNVLFDKSSPLEVKREVMSTSTCSRNCNTASVENPIEGKDLISIKMAYCRGEKIEKGDFVNINIKPGALGIKWISHIDLCALSH